MKIVFHYTWIMRWEENNNLSPECVQLTKLDGFGCSYAFNGHVDWMSDNTILQFDARIDNWRQFSSSHILKHVVNYT